MRVRLRKYCYDCRKGTPWLCRQRGRHSWYWEYFIHHNGIRVATSGPFRVYQAALQSAERKWNKLVEAGIIQDDIPNGQA